MPKKVFWPAAMLVMGIIFFGTNTGAFASEFANLWAIVLIVAGLGGLLLSDREEWLSNAISSKNKNKKVKKTTKTVKATKKKTAKRKTKK